MNHKIVFLFLFIAAVPLYGQETLSHTILHTARDYQEKGYYNQAYLEYKRYTYIYRKKNKDIPGSIYKELAYNCYYRKKYADAAGYLDLYRNTTDEYRKEDLFLELEIMKNAFSSDLNRLRLYSLGLKVQSYPASIQPLILYLNLKYAITQNDWKNFELFLSTVEENQFLSKEAENSIMEELNKLEDSKELSPKFASFLSVIIPGGGQLYAGYPGEALKAFIVNGTFIALSWYSLSNKYFGDFIAWESTRLFRFYKGNIANAQDYTLERNKNRIQDIRNNLLEIVNSHIEQERTKIKNNIAFEKANPY